MKRIKIGSVDSYITRTPPIEEVENQNPQENLSNSLSELQLRIDFPENVTKPNNFPIENVKDLQIKMTYDYDKFSFAKGNRSLNQGHLKNLFNSISKRYLFTCISVNEKFEIIDGHHRFHIIKTMKLPLFYIVLNKYSTEELIVYNQTVKAWNIEGYIQSYCNLGYKEYIDLYNFKKKYNLGWHATKTILLLGESFDKDSFERGNFKIKDLRKSTEIVESIYTLKGLFSHYNKRYFVTAIVRLIMSNADFSVDEFREKLKLNPSWMRYSSRMEDCLSDIEKIYNWKRRDKVSLRYL